MLNAILILLGFLAMSGFALGMAQGQPYKVTDSLYKLMRFASRFGAYASELYTKLNSMPFANVVLKSADYSLVAADNGKTVVLTGAANITLPVASATVGPYHLANIADNNCAILAPASNDTLISINDAAADSVAFSTASNKIGTFASCFAVDVDGAGTYKWFVTNSGGTTRTVT
jgi:hypothetical protein